MKTTQDLRFLLLQARMDEMRYHEHDCFSLYSGVPKNNIACFDMTKGMPPKDLIEKYDGIFMGGSGEFSITQNPAKWTVELEDLTKYLIDHHGVMFASCFGHQVLAHAIGGKVEHMPEKMEVGTYPLTLTEEGKKNPLLKDMPPTFMVQLGHQDHVVDLPSSCVNLGSTELCEMQAFWVPNTLIYTSQFHPELSFDDMVKRVTFYASHGYIEEGTTTQQVIDSFKEAPESYTILTRFVSLVLEDINSR